MIGDGPWRRPLWRSPQSRCLLPVAARSNRSTTRDSSLVAHRRGAYRHGPDHRTAAHADRRRATAATPTPVATAGRACTAADLDAVLPRAERGSRQGRARLRAAATAGPRPATPTAGRASSSSALERSAAPDADPGESPGTSSVHARLGDRAAPGEWASFRVIATDQGSSGGTTGCDTADALRVVAPDDTDHDERRDPGRRLRMLGRDRVGAAVTGRGRRLTGLRSPQTD